jgi:hypothetical protein
LSIVPKNPVRTFFQVLRWSLCIGAVIFFIVTLNNDDPDKLMSLASSLFVAVFSHFLTFLASYN